MLRFIQHTESEPAACLAPAPEIIDDPVDVEDEDVPCEADPDCSANSHCGDDGICVLSCTSSDACSDGEVCATDGRCIAEEDTVVVDEDGDGGTGGTPSSDEDGGCGCNAVWSRAWKSDDPRPARKHANAKGSKH